MYAASVVHHCTVCESLCVDGLCDALAQGSIIDQLEELEESDR